jgi:hypothetical protein
MFVTHFLAARSARISACTISGGASAGPIETRCLDDGKRTTPWVVEAVGPHGSAVRVHSSAVRSHIAVGLLRVAEATMLGTYGLEDDA